MQKAGNLPWTSVWTSWTRPVVLKRLRGLTWSSGWLRFRKTSRKALQVEHWVHLLRLNPRLRYICQWSTWSYLPASTFLICIYFCFVVDFQQKDTEYLQWLFASKLCLRDAKEASISLRIFRNCHAESKGNSPFRLWFLVRSVPLCGIGIIWGSGYI